MIAAPALSEFHTDYARYVSLVSGQDLTATLDAQIARTLRILGQISDEKSLHRYAPGKWSIRELVGHLSDAERIMAYRALCFARNDQNPIPGFDQDPYVAAANSDARPWKDLISEFEHLRRSTILNFRGLPPEAELRSGIANKSPITVRALGYVIAGHELHHMRILEERYL